MGHAGQALTSKSRRTGSAGVPSNLGEFSEGAHGAPTNLSPVTDSPTAKFSHTWWLPALTWPACRLSSPAGGFLLQLPEEANMYSLRKWHAVSLLSIDHTGHLTGAKVISLDKLSPALCPQCLKLLVFRPGDFSTSWVRRCLLSSLQPLDQEKTLMGCIVANSCITCFWPQPSFEEFLQVLVADAESSARFSQAVSKPCRTLDLLFSQMSFY